MTIHSLTSHYIRKVLIIQPIVSKSQVDLESPTFGHRIELSCMEFKQRPGVRCFRKGVQCPLLGIQPNLREIKIRAGSSTPQKESSTPAARVHVTFYNKHSSKRQRKKCKNKSTGKLPRCFYMRKIAPTN